jgi:hypothetical protein
MSKVFLLIEKKKKKKSYVSRSSLLPLVLGRPLWTSLDLEKKERKKNINDQASFFEL